MDTFYKDWKELPAEVELGVVKGESLQWNWGWKGNRFLISSTDEKMNQTKYLLPLYFDQMIREYAKMKLNERIAEIKRVLGF